MDKNIQSVNNNNKFISQFFENHGKNHMSLHQIIILLIDFYLLCFNNITPLRFYLYKICSSISHAIKIQALYNIYQGTCTGFIVIMTEFALNSVTIETNNEWYFYLTNDFINILNK